MVSTIIFSWYNLVFKWLLIFPWWMQFYQLSLCLFASCYCLYMSILECQDMKLWHMPLSMFIYMLLLWSYMDSLFKRAWLNVVTCYCYICLIVCSFACYCYYYLFHLIALIEMHLTLFEIFYLAVLGPLPSRILMSCFLILFA